MDLTRLLMLNRGDTIRRGRIIPKFSMLRLLRSVYEGCTRGRAQYDREEIERLLPPLIAALAGKNDLSPRRLQQIMEVEARLSVSALYPELMKSSHYAVLRKLMAKKQRYILKSQNLYGLDHEVYRWLTSTPFQRRYAAYMNKKTLPLKAKEIPAGAVLLTDVHAMLIGYRVKGYTITLRHYAQWIKAALFTLCTGKHFTHAELCLGDGRFFHLTRQKSGYGCVIKDVAEKVCYKHRVLLPNEARFLTALREGGHTIEGFAAFIRKVADEAETNGAKVRTKGPHIVYTIGLSQRKRYPIKRRKSWDPENVRYTCSGVISALFAHCGVDFAKDLGKIPDDFNPGDFASSAYFEKAL